MLPSANSPAEKSGDSDSGENRSPAGSPLDQVAALLNAEADGTDDGENRDAELDDDDQGTGKPGENRNSAKPPKNLDDVAKQLGVEVEDLYSLEFTLPGAGESHTLGELKDVMGEHSSFEVERLQFAEERTKTEAGFLKAQAELTDLISLLPPSAVKPELINAIKDKREQTLTRERSYTLQAIPAWKDDDAESADRKDMQAHLSEYGYAANYLDQVVDHRMLKYIRDNMQRQQRITAALEKVRKVQKPGHKPSGKTSKKPAPVRRGRRARTESAQIAGVAELLANN